MALGVIPTFKGYAVRTRQQHEAELMQALSPERADQLGPALGLRVTSTWVVRGIPAKATRQQIIAALDRATPTWQGWTVIPRKRIGIARGPAADWLVDAADDPSLLGSVVNGTPISIKRHVDDSRATSRTSAWATGDKGKATNKDTQKIDTKTTPLFATEDDDREFEMDDSPGPFAQAGQDLQGQEAEQATDDASVAAEVVDHNVQSPPKPTPKATPQPRAPPSAKLGAALEPRTFDRSRSPHTTTTRPPVDAIVAQLRQDIATRDAMIMTLNQSIAALTAQMQEMQTQFQKQMQEQQQQQQQQQQQTQQQAFQQHMLQMQAAFQTAGAAQEASADM